MTCPPTHHLNSLYPIKSGACVLELNFDHNLQSSLRSPLPSYGAAFAFICYFSFGICVRALAELAPLACTFRAAAVCIGFSAFGINGSRSARLCRVFGAAAVCISVSAFGVSGARSDRLQLRRGSRVYWSLSVRDSWSSLRSPFAAPSARRVCIGFSAFGISGTRSARLQLRLRRGSRVYWFLSVRD